MRKLLSVFPAACSNGRLWQLSAVVLCLAFLSWNVSGSKANTTQYTHTQPAQPTVHCCSEVPSSDAHNATHWRLRTTRLSESLLTRTQWSLLCILLHAVGSRSRYSGLIFRYRVPHFAIWRQRTESKKTLQSTTSAWTTLLVTSSSNDCHLRSIDFVILDFFTRWHRLDLSSLDYAFLISSIDVLRMSGLPRFCGCVFYPI